MNESIARPALTVEDQSVLEWRYTQLRALGFEREDARILAEGPAELALVRRLIADGCPRELALQIVQ